MRAQSAFCLLIFRLLLYPLIRLKRYPLWGVSSTMWCTLRLVNNKPLITICLWSFLKFFHRASFILSRSAKKEKLGCLWERKKCIKKNEILFVWTLPQLKMRKWKEHNNKYTIPKRVTLAVGRKRNHLVTLVFIKLKCCGGCKGE